MNRYIIYVLAALVFVASSCEKFLDVMPDNRTELDNTEKIRAFLTSAYPETDYMLLTEFMSDNVDDYGENNPNHDRFIDQVFAWEDVTESDNEDPEMLWGNTYIAIAAANQVIEAIDNLGGPEAAGMQAEYAEARLCRAYNHFVLTSVFAHSYSSTHSKTDLGVTYMLQPEQGLNPKYERQTVAECYDLIDKDLQVALPHVSDSYYTVPKYHFNKKAAYAFATQFYLFYEKYDLAVKYADLCLGSATAAVLRDWKYTASMTQDQEVIRNHYIDASLSCNLMLLTAYSKMGLCFGPYSTYSRYSHGNYLATNEDAIALATLMGSNNSGFYHQAMKIYSATNLDKVIFWKIPYLFEYTDPVAQIGYYRTVYPAFSTDLVLLERAEAKILSNDYEGAVKDMEIWINNISKRNNSLSVDDIVSKMNAVEYSAWDASTVKKHLNPEFEIDAEGTTQECLLQFCLLLKRVETLGQGQRLFDVKRYGIEIERRIISAAGMPLKVVDKLEVRDPRRALQIPLKVTDAGYTPNPR